MSGIDIISDTTGQAIVESIKALGTKMSGGKVVYGVHINSGDSNPSTSVRYLADAAGMTPARMNYTTGKFDYGSWGNAFFLPRPCMLKTDGTVDYYLNENDYSKKADGTASDIANVNYDGNAMMEWGDGTNLIWWKIEPDKGNANSASLYVANYQADDSFNCLNHYDIDGNRKAHFYTAIYNGSLDSNNKLRSLSGQTVMKSKTASQEMSYAAANGKGYYIEQFVDRLLINMLLIIMGKSLDTQSVFGKGMSENAADENLLLNTGTMNTKGLFWGENTGKAGVKVFGIENYYGNQWRRVCGLIYANGTIKVKLSPSMKDGSTVSNYNTDGTGYIAIPNSTITGTSGGYIKKMLFTVYGMFESEVTGSSSTYYCDGGWFDNAIIAFAVFGGYLDRGAYCGASYVDLITVAGFAGWGVGAPLSFK